MSYIIPTEEQMMQSLQRSNNALREENFRLEREINNMPNFPQERNRVITLEKKVSDLEMRLKAEQERRDIGTASYEATIRNQKDEIKILNARLTVCQWSHEAFSGAIQQLKEKTRDKVYRWYSDIFQKLELGDIND